MLTSNSKMKNKLTNITNKNRLVGRLQNIQPL